MSKETVSAALAAKEGMLAFLDVDFDYWVHLHKTNGSSAIDLYPDDAALAQLRETTRSWVRSAEVFAVEPVMSAVVTMAAEDLPPEAAFVPDDLPTGTGLLYFAEPFTLPAADVPGSAGRDCRPSCGGPDRTCWTCSCGRGRHTREECATRSPSPKAPSNTGSRPPPCSTVDYGSQH